MKINEIFEKNKPITVNDYLNYCGVKDINKYLNPIWEIDNPKGYYNIDEAIKRLKGIDCNGRGTSCPDQLAKALEEINQ